MWSVYASLLRPAHFGKRHLSNPSPYSNADTVRPGTVRTRPTQAARPKPRGMPSPGSRTFRHRWGPRPPATARSLRTRNRARTSRVPPTSPASARRTMSCSCSLPGTARKKVRSRRPTSTLRAVISRGPERRSWSACSRLPYSTPSVRLVESRRRRATRTPARPAWSSPRGRARTTRPQVPTRRARSGRVSGRRRGRRALRAPGPTPDARAGPQA